MTEDKLPLKNISTHYILKLTKLSLVTSKTMNYDLPFSYDILSHYYE